MTRVSDERLREMRSRLGDDGFDDANAEDVLEDLADLRAAFAQMGETVQGATELLTAAIAERDRLRAALHTLIEACDASRAYEGRDDVADAMDAASATLDREASR